MHASGQTASAHQLGARRANDWKAPVLAALPCTTYQHIILSLCLVVCTCKPIRHQTASKLQLYMYLRLTVVSMSTCSLCFTSTATAAALSRCVGGFVLHLCESLRKILPLPPGTPIRACVKTSILGARPGWYSLATQHPGLYSCTRLFTSQQNILNSKTPVRKSGWKMHMFARTASSPLCAICRASSSAELL